MKNGDFYDENATLNCERLEEDGENTKWLLAKADNNKSYVKSEKCLKNERKRQKMKQIWRKMPMESFLGDFH